MIPPKITLTLAALAALTAFGHASIITWDGEGGDGLWTTPSNWFDSTNSTNDVLPATGDTVNISNGDTVTSPTDTLTGNLTINLTGNSTLTRPSSVIRLNNATINVEAGSGITGNGFWDLQNADFVFDDGAIATIAQWEQKGVNTFTFNLGPTGFTTLLPGTFRNDGNNPASPATLIADDTYTVDMANYTGGIGVITLIDFVADAEGMDNTTFQNATLNVVNAGAYTANLQWNDTAESIELNITAAAAIPEASEALVFLLGMTGLVASRRRRR